MWRCDVTKNPVGTDTRMIGAPDCECQGCRASRMQASMIETLSKIATGRIGDGWATDRLQWQVCRDIANEHLRTLNVELPRESVALPALQPATKS